jgi:pimeloyl-ACP methyl ester carboxylesterase
LTAAANAGRTYPIDPDRIWISGFSGGARIAERMALAYPDVFTGAIVDGSSDIIGTPDLPLPSRDNFERLLDRMSIVFSTGRMDDYNTNEANRAVLSWRRHCFDRLSVEVRPNEGHVAMNARSLAKAIAFLDRPRGELSPKGRQCREELYSEVDGELTRAAALVEQRNRGAISALRTIDRRYGRLAAPRSLELRARAGD